MVKSTASLYFKTSLVQKICSHPISHRKYHWILDPASIYPYITNGMSSCCRNLHLSTITVLYQPTLSSDTELTQAFAVLAQIR